jgi:hypothetical protein
LELNFALAQNPPDKTLKGLRHGGVRDVTLELIELAGGEQAPRQSQDPVEVVNDRGLADGGISGDENEFRLASRDDVTK